MILLKEYGWLTILLLFPVAPLILYGNLGLDFSSIRTRKNVSRLYYRLALISIGMFSATLGVYFQATHPIISLVFKLLLASVIFLYVLSIIDNDKSDTNNE